MLKAPWFRKNQDEWLREILKVHFDKKSGTPYWLKKEKELGISVLDEIRSIGDLKLLGPMKEEDLVNLPIEEFLPKTFLKKKKNLVICETGGTTGKIKTTAYLEAEFQHAFVEFFRFVAGKRRFPVELNWAFIGPSGPHIIFKSAQAMAHSFSSMEPFSVDFDPRWIKKMEKGSSGFERYKEHVLEQAERIFSVQEIGVLFTTPVIAIEVGERLSFFKREKIKGIHLGGMVLTAEDYQKIKKLYPYSVIIPGYGNTLFGLTLELSPSKDHTISYYPPGPRLVIKIIEKKANCNDNKRIAMDAEIGERGQVMFHRLDKSFFIPNLIERDEGKRVEALKEWKQLGFYLDGVKDPAPLSELKQVLREGLY